MSRAFVQTATGPVDVDRLGSVLMHEHIFTFHSDLSADYPWREEGEYERGAIEKLAGLRDFGFGAIVDLTVVGLGRDVRRIARISEAAQVAVLVATGIYASSALPIYFARQRELVSESFLEDFLAREIESGIGDSGIRAAVIKCVTDREGVTPDVDHALRSAARAHLRTGVPLSTHSNPSARTGLEQQRVFREEGVDMGNVVIGHSDETTDLGHLEELIAAGSWLGMDRFGQYNRVSFDDKVDTVVELCRRGYSSRLVLSHDANCGGDVAPHLALTEWRFGHIPEVVIPALRERGVRDEDLDLMLTINPGRILAPRKDRTVT